MHLPTVMLHWLMFVASAINYHHDVASAANVDQDLQQAFEGVYSGGVWGESGGGSGAGSTLPATQYTQSILRAIINAFGLKSMADVPCGSMHWMPMALRDVRADVAGFTYLGADIVRPVLEANQDKFKAQRQWMRFEVLDFTVDLVPAGYELIFCRDALQHLPYSKIVSALQNFSNSTARYLAVGSYLHDNTNTDVSAGDAFAINLAKPPFLLTGYQHAYQEHSQETLGPGYPEKFILLYSIEYLRSVNFEDMHERSQT